VGGKDRHAASALVARSASPCASRLT
jgi:hypothetical protein